VSKGRDSRLYANVAVYQVSHHGQNESPVRSDLDDAACKSAHKAMIYYVANFLVDHHERLRTKQQEDPFVGE
jgi:hypothetical protein